MAEYLTLTAFRAALTSAGGAGSRTAAQLPVERLQHHLDQAHAQVLGRLARDYTVVPPGNVDPPPPPLLAEIVAGHAAYTATLEHNGSQDVGDRDPVVLRYNHARELLAQVVKGTLVLPGITDASQGAVVGDPEAFGPPGVGLAGDVDLSSTTWAGTHGRWHHP